MSLSWIGVSGLGATSVMAASAEEYRQLGLSYRQQGRYQDAIEALKTAVNLDPTHVSGQVILGWTQHLADQDESAALTLNQALQVDPFAVPAANALGIVYLVQDQLAAAIMTHLWAAYLKPDNEIAYFNLSLATQRIGYDDWAIELASQAIPLEPYNPHPLIAKAIAHWSKGEQRQALQFYQQAIALSPHYHTHSLSIYLKAAAFHPDQIQIAEQVRQRYQ